MTLTEISTMLQSISTNIPIFYHHADKGAKVPFITYTCVPEDNFSADNQTYTEVYSLHIVFYTQVKDITSEELIKTKLTAYEIPYSQDEVYVNDETCYQEIFDAKVIGG